MHLTTHLCPPIADLSFMQVGGRPKAYIQTWSEEDIQSAYQWAEQQQLPVYILGGGSNIVCADGVLHAVVIQPKNQRIEWKKVNTGWQVRAHAGALWENLVHQAVQRKAWGIECLAGIPGHVGAAPIQNIGAYGQSLSDHCTAVRVFDRAQQSFETLTPQECCWSYRDSIFKQHPQRYCVVWIELSLGSTATPIRYVQLQDALDQQGIDSDQNIETIYHTVRRIRASKSMLWDKEDPNHRSVGSFFLNPIVSQDQWHFVCTQAQKLNLEHVPHWPQEQGIKLAAAWLIEQSGCHKGYTHSEYSGVALSSKHTLAIINRGTACATDVIRFATLIQNRVEQQFAVTLEIEARIWGFDFS